MDILKILKEKKALLEGHFLLSSGLHSGQYIQLALVLQYPLIAEKIAEALARKFKDKKVDVVISPALGGIVIGYQIAKFLKARAIFSERENSRMTLRRGFNIFPNEKVLIVEDVVTTAKSIKEVKRLVKKKKGTVVGYGCVVDRRKNKKSLSLKSLLKLHIKIFSPRNCPLCKKGVSLIKPGSRTFKTR